MIRFYEPIIWHQRGIRSHSVFNDRSYAMPVRRREPVYIPPRTTKYSSYHDYGIDDSINRADYLSNAVLEDTFEAASRSRGKDHALLRNVNAAIDGIYYRVPRSSNLQASRPPLRATQASSLSRVSSSVSSRSVITLSSLSSTKFSRPAFQPSLRSINPPLLDLLSLKLPVLPPVNNHRQQPNMKLPATPSTRSVGTSSVKIPAYYAAGGDPNHLPVSDLRRKLRRTIARAKNNPDYFRE
uniref:Uncharacterized protein n=1 Tax=Arion vulgaris TaxID=1028688 RepID=A0A0B7ACV3_9EUPU